jgi:hypothetical protein
LTKSEMSDMLFSNYGIEAACPATEKGALGL